jgi:hypothetical protein
MITTAMLKEWTPRNITVGLHHDQFPENPTEYSDWRVVSLCRRHTSFGEIEDNDELQRQVNEGTAFLLSYFEHGLCRWSLSGEGPQCPWDSVHFAGVLYWEGEEKPTEEQARSFIETYTEWCNGSVYGYTIEDEEGEIDDSCFGFYGNDLDYMFEELSYGIRPFDKVRFVGDASHLSDYHQIKQSA